MSQSHWDYLTAKENQRQVVFWTMAAVAVPAAGAFLWWLSEKSYNNLAPYRVKATVWPASCHMASAFPESRHRVTAPITDMLCSTSIGQAPFLVISLECWQAMLTGGGVSFIMQLLLLYCAVAANPYSVLLCRTQTCQSVHGWVL